VISNGKLISVKENQDGTRTYDWKIDDAHATYLTSIIVGEFVPVTGDYAGISDHDQRVSKMKLKKEKLPPRACRRWSSSFPKKPA